MERKLTKEPSKNSELIFYQTEDGRTHLEVRLEENTVWLSQKLIADLFQKDVRTINEHILNIFEEGELLPESTIRKFRIVQKEGERTVERDIDFYNLDVIISVGYRVNSKRDTQFRIWATNVLRRHLVDGYTINEKRLKAQRNKILELQDTVRLLSNVALLEGVSDEAKGIVQIIAEYSGPSSRSVVL